MYQVYIKKASGFDSRKLVGEFNDYAQAQEAVQSELAKNNDVKYVVEETTGAVNVYGDLIVDVIDEN